MKIHKKIHRQETRLLHHLFFGIIYVEQIFNYVAEVFSQLRNLNPNLHQEENRMQQTFKYFFYLYIPNLRQMRPQEHLCETMGEEIKILKSSLKGKNIYPEEEWN